MFHPDDSDIKYFHPSEEKVRATDKDTLDLAQIMDAQRSNGNLTLARRLGESLAEITPENSRQISGFDLGADIHSLGANVLYQVRVLMLFSAQLSLHSALPSILSSEAVNAMYNKVRELSEGFYDNVMEGTSFSFYYLAVRKGVDVEKNIGRKFAMLCGDDDNDELISLGEKTYDFSLKYVTKLINDFKFVK